MPPAPQNLVVLGVFGAAHGLKGEIRLKSYTEEPLAIASYAPLLTKSGRQIKLASLRQAKDVLIARVEGVSDRTGAEQLVNLQLFVERAALGTPEDEDEFFHADLIGLVARDEAGNRIGTVTGLFDFGGGDIVEVTPDGAKGAPDSAKGGPGGAKPLLLPFTKAVVPLVDIKAGHIVVVLPEETGAADEAEEASEDER
ncbi:ribosome maturation factor RimM [Labrys sp. KNU-23]|uniref:ribosome maturation factor RimM n=1 Tax=Labrys sp. KNU-23 TaxID=2789216 RepID=UPI0011EE3819|nr:ribosome maturation factor RimM [Labrys sp. KNU-23]QEN88575.1 ribosome maturation factor RimM [Labrys sp. KNU-23]